MAQERGFREIGWIQGATARRAENCGCQGQCWTRGKVGHMSSECRWRVARADEEEDSDSRGTGNRKSGQQTASEENGEVGGVWIVGNVMELDEEEEEGTGRQGCRSKYWARKDRSDRFGKIREEQREGIQ